MLRDELKKSLEPIQTSPELLEKTRKAIEEARLEQARKTVASQSYARSSSRNSLSLKALIPVACAVLLIAGIAVAWPFVEGNKKSSEKRSHAIQQHNDAIIDVVAEIDSDLNYKGNMSMATESIVEWENTGDAEETTTAPTWAESAETEPNIELPEKNNSDDKNFLGPNSRYSEVGYVVIGDYIIHISDDGKKLLLLSTQTGEDVPNTPEHNVPALRELGENEKIIGLTYDDKNSLLYITTEENGQVKLYSCKYENGKVVGENSRIEN